MSKLILMAVAVVVVVWLLKRAFAGRKPGAGASPQAPGEAKGDLVSCAHCAVNLPKSESRDAGGRHYCSEEHVRLGPRDG